MPQIELMQSDLPHTLYVRSAKPSERGPEKTVITQADIDEATRLNMESLKRSRERRKRQQEQGYTINEIFNGEADK